LKRKTPEVIEKRGREKDGENGNCIRAFIDSYETVLKKKERCEYKVG